MTTQIQWQKTKLSLFKTVTNNTLICHCLKQWQISKNKKIVTVFNSDKSRNGLSLFKTVTNIKTKKIVTVLNSDKPIRDLSLLKTVTILLFFDICHCFKQWQTNARFVTILNSDKLMHDLILLITVTIFLVLIFVTVLNSDKPKRDLSLLKTVTIFLFFNICHYFKQWQTNVLFVTV